MTGSGDPGDDSGGNPAGDLGHPPVVRDGTAMLGGMTPALQPGAFVFVSLPADRATALLPHAVAMLREAEGVSLILPASLAEEAGHAGAPHMAMITLQVFSALEGVGLTAGVATALAQAGIACNMVAGFHHDHPFVPADRAAEAMEVLRALQTRNAGG